MNQKYGHNCKKLRAEPHKTAYTAENIREKVRYCLQLNETARFSPVVFRAEKA